MNTSSTGAYALKLFAWDPEHADRVAGRLEHVLSGRRHDFDSGPALLASLALEQRQLASAATPPVPVDE